MKMKKSCCLVLAAVLTIGFASCNSNRVTSDDLANDTNLGKIETLTADQLTWFVDPTWEYETVEPIPGSAFSDVVPQKSFANGTEAFFDGQDSFQFCEMSYPLYSNLPAYYNVKDKDGQWKVFYMPDKVDTGTLDVGRTVRYDAMGIYIASDPNLFVGGTDLSSPWEPLFCTGRGGADGGLYWEDHTEQAYFYKAEAGGFSWKKVDSISLHKPYPVKKFNITGLNREIENEFTGTFAEDSPEVIFEDSLYAYISPDGNLLTDFIYEQAGDFSDGLAACCKNGKWGYLNENGDEITDFVYDSLWNTNTEDDFNITGGDYLAPQAYPCTDDTMVVMKDGEYGLLSRDGSTLIAFGELEAMAPSWNHQLWAKQGGKWGLIDLTDVKQKAGVSADESGEETDEEPSEISIQRDDRSVQDENGDTVFTMYYDKVVLQGPSPICEKVNQQIEQACTEFFADQMAVQQQDAAWQAYHSTGPFIHTATVSVLNQQDILSIRLDIENYFGGMHGFLGVGTLNFDLKTGEQLVLSDLFSINGSELRFYLQQECKDYIDQSPDMGWIDAKEKINELPLEQYLFYIHDGMVYIQFAQYELGAGAMGCVSIPCKIV